MKPADQQSPPQGHTLPRVDGERSPRLPHEHDESADSQQMAEIRPEMKQAHEDLRRGLVDTGRGSVVDQVYRHTLKSEKTATTPEKPG